MNNKILKRIILPFLIGMIYCASSLGQGCDPQINQFSILHPTSCLGEDVTTDIEIQWTMAGGDPSCVAPAGSWTIQINLPASSTYKVNSAADVTTPDLFNWALGADGHTLTGTSNADISWLESGTIIVNIEGDVGNSCSSVVSNTNIQIIPSAAGGSPASFSNDTANDVQSDAIGVDALLPVEFSHVNARSQDCENVDVIWQTQTEINSKGFFIERSVGSVDRFEDMGFVESNGNSNKEQTYTFEDNINDLSGNSNLYYRIKQVDIDGRFSFSEMVVIRLDCEDQAVRFNVRPNPAFNDLYVDVDGSLDVASKIVVLNSLSQTIATLPINKTDSRTLVDVTKYIAGMYYIRILNNNNEVIFTEKIIVTK